MPEGENDDWFRRDGVGEAASLARKRDEALRRMSARAEAAWDADGAAKAAAEAFAAVTAGISPMLGTGYAPPPPWASSGAVGGVIPSTYDQSEGRIYRAPKLSKEEIVGLVAEQVRSAGAPEDVLRAGGEWITLITNAITEAIKVSETEQEGRS